MTAEAAEALLCSMLEERGVDYRREWGLVRLRVRRDGLLWEVNCLPGEGRMVLYGRYPFVVHERAAALERCNALNRRISRGAMLLPEDGRPVFRLCVDLEDVYEAGYRTARSMEELAETMVRYWEVMRGETDSFFSHV